MPEIDDQIKHVSDTALMVAGCRALETADPDGFVRDPLAERVAGERGMAIARALPGLQVMRFGVGMRSRFLDELVAYVTNELGVETVLSVGAGLDTRPWRLDLPRQLRWIEVDFPALLDYKAAVLAGEPPVCRLERMSADLTVATERQAIFQAAGAAPALMITEGLLMYLPGESIEALATEAATLSGVRHWLLDLTTPAFSARVHNDDAYRTIGSMRAAGHLDGAQIQAVLERNGWASERRRTYARDLWTIDSERVRALVRSGPRPGQAAMADDPSGVHLFSHA